MDMDVVMDDAPPLVAMQVIGDDLRHTPGWHSHKWSGIALAPNGKLYCSPHTASKVLRIDPATDATELIGDDLSAHGEGSPRGHMWSGIAAAPDGKLYCSPRSASRVLRIDPATGATELIGDDLSPQCGPHAGWSDIAAASDGKLYCSPYGASRVLRIDPATGATELIGDDLEDGGWSGIALASDGKLYCSPGGAMCVLRIDPATDETDEIGTVYRGGYSTRGWSGIAAAADGKLYCPPGNAFHVLRIDPATGKTKKHSKKIGKQGDSWSGIAAGVDGGTLYCPPTGASRVLRIPLPHADGEGGEGEDGEDGEKKDEKKDGEKKRRKEPMKRAKKAARRR